MHGGKDPHQAREPVTNRAQGDGKPPTAGGHEPLPTKRGSERNPSNQRGNAHHVGMVEIKLPVRGERIKHGPSENRPQQHVVPSGGPGDDLTLAQQLGNHPHTSMVGRREDEPVLSPSHPLDDGGMLSSFGNRP